MFIGLRLPLDGQFFQHMSESKPVRAWALVTIDQGDQVEMQVNVRHFWAKEGEESIGILISNAGLPRPQGVKDFCCPLNFKPDGAGNLVSRDRNIFG